jgi:hypothetical protein
MFAGILKKLSDFPNPDMTSDAMLYKNMRDFSFIRDASIDVSQIINLRDENRDEVRERHPFENAVHKHITPKEYDKFSNMLDSSQATYYNGIVARMNYITSGDYSLTPELPTDKSLQRSPAQQIFVLFNAERQDYIKENYKPGSKMGDNKRTYKDTVNVHSQRQMELYGKYEEMEQYITKTITNAQVRDIKKEVLKPEPKVKDNENSRENFSKQLLNANKKVVINQSEKKNTLPQKNREVKL